MAKKVVASLRDKSGVNMLSIKSVKSENLEPMYSKKRL